jgi:hypothetical protein
MKPDKLLYHYTNIAAAISILQSGVLYFSHCKKMNDPTELIHADALVQMAFKQAHHEMLRKDGKFSSRLKFNDYEKADNADSRALTEIMSKLLGDDYYIFSSTQHHERYEKENGSLVMWRGYGREDGCAIVFDKEKLVALVDDLPKNNKAVSAIDGKVTYSEAIREVKEVYAKEYRLLVDYAKNIIEAAWRLGGEQFYKEVDGLNPYIKMKALTKHPAFKSENEYRLSILRSMSTKNGTNSNLIPVEDGTIKLPITSDGIPIKKIIISPFSNQDKNYAIMQQFIKSKPEYMNIRITKSAIPHT